MTRPSRQWRDTLERRYLEAELLFAQGQVQEALQECRAIIEQDPHHARARFMAACIFEMQGAYERAIALIEDILKDGPTPEYEVVVRANLALDYLELGQFGRALDCCRRALQLEPDSFQINNNMAYILNSQKRFQESLPYARKACRLNPNDDGAFGNLGEACLALGHLEEALQAFERSVELTRPGDVMLVIRKVRLETTRRELEARLDTVQQRLEPKSADEINRAAVEAEERGDFEEANRYFKLAISVEPGNPVRYGNYGHALYRQGRLEEAISEFEKAIEIDPAKSQYYVDIGEVWLALDRPHEALENVIFGTTLLQCEGELDETLLQMVFGNILDGLFNRLGLRSQQVRDAYVSQKRQELDQRLQLSKDNDM